MSASVFCRPSYIISFRSRERQPRASPASAHAPQLAHSSSSPSSSPSSSSSPSPPLQTQPEQQEFSSSSSSSSPPPQVEVDPLSLSSVPAQSETNNSGTMTEQEQEQSTTSFAKVPESSLAIPRSISTEPSQPVAVVVAAEATAAAEGDAESPSSSSSAKKAAHSISSMDRIVGHGNPQSGTGSELDHCDRRRIDSSVGDSAASSSSSSSSVSYSPVMGSPIITCLAAAPGGDKIGGSGLTAKSNNGDRGSNLNLNIENNSNSRGGTKDQGQDQDCAICLDVIMPRKHAKAILACRHEFHLSCISMAFAMGKEMVCPLCRYLHEDQPFMSLEAEDGVKPTTASFPTRRSPHHHTTAYHPHPSSSSTASTHHEHPTGGTVLSMMPSLFETSLGHGPAAGTIRTSPDGICLKTSTWLMLYAFPFSIALCFLAFVLGKVETMWSKVSCLIGAAICYMVCWGLVVAVMDPDHEARALLEMLNQMQESEAAAALRSGRTVNSPANFASPSTSSVATLVGSDSTTPSASTSSLEAVALSWSAWWVQQRYAQGIRNRMTDLAGMLDDLPDMMGEW